MESPANQTDSRADAPSAADLAALHALQKEGKRRELIERARLLSDLRVQRLTAPLFDATRFTRHIEDGYRQAFQRYVDGLPPNTIILEP